MTELHLKVIKMYSDKYGLNANLRVTAEELAELIQAILKYDRVTAVDNAVVRVNVDTAKNVMLNELVDVYYCLGYVHEALGLSDEEIQTALADKVLQNKTRYEKHNKQ
jgi:NTP pyrophosphatase (non-canonical NTP hydrolase)